MAEYSNMLARGGNARVAFGLAIEGLDDTFTNDPSRTQLGEFGWTYSTDRVSKLGLAAELGIVIEEQADWRGAKLSAGGLRLVVRDTDTADRATRAFGGRNPSLRTFLTADVSDTEVTSIDVVTTAGWPSSGILHIGREAIYYEATTATSFDTLTRGHLGTVACAHDAGNGGIEVTDVPAAMERRRAQLVLFVDSVASASADVIFRGIVESTREMPSQVGYEIQVAHNSVLLDQEFGESLRPFGIRGFYFSDLDPLTVHVYEHAERYLSAATYVFELSLTGFYEDAEALTAAITAQMRDGANWMLLSDGTTGALPVNDEYGCVVHEGSLTITFRAHSSTPKFVTLSHSHTLFGNSNRGSDLDPETTASSTRLATGVVYFLRPQAPNPLPSAYVIVGGYLDGRSRITEPTYPANRIYYSAGAPTTLTHFWPYDREISDVLWRVVDVDTSAGFFELDSEGGGGRFGFRFPFIDTGDAKTEFEPINHLGEKPWHDVLRALVEATPSTGSTGVTPWLPEDEFDLDDIEEQSLGAGASAFVGRWIITEATSLRKLFEPHLLMLGLCWVSGYDGRLTVRALDVVTDAANADGEYTDRDGDWAAEASTESSRDGVVNVCRVKGGYDPRAGEWARTQNGAIDENSIAIYDKVELEIEPINGELSETSYTLAMRDALAGARIVATHAYPYVHATLTGIPGLKLARLLVGDTLSVTDKRIPFAGVRGVVAQRSQVVGKRVVWFGQGAPSVDLVVRLSGWDAAGYAPAARITWNSLAGGNMRVTMRDENWYSDPPRTGSTKRDYQWFRVGDVVRVRELDVATENVVANCTITAIDTDNRYITVDQNLSGLGINTSGKIHVMEQDERANLPATASDANDPPQRAYAWVADASHTNTDGETARVYAA